MKSTASNNKNKHIQGSTTFYIIALNVLLLIVQYKYDQKERVQFASSYFVAICTMGCIFPDVLISPSGSVSSAARFHPPDFLARIPNFIFSEEIHYRLIASYACYLYVYMANIEGIQIFWCVFYYI